VEHINGTSHGTALALTTNVGLGWKSLSGTNTTVYHKNCEIFCPLFMMQKPAVFKNKFNQKLFVLQTLKQTRTKKASQLLCLML
jgi:hypothetical protein